MNQIEISSYDHFFYWGSCSRALEWSAFKAVWPDIFYVCISRKLGWQRALTYISNQVRNWSEKGAGVPSSFPPSCSSVSMLPSSARRAPLPWRAAVPLAERKRRGRRRGSLLSDSLRVGSCEPRLLRTGRWIPRSLVMQLWKPNAVHSGNKIFTTSVAVSFPFFPMYVVVWFIRECQGHVLILCP